MDTSSTRRSLLKLATGAAAYGAGVTTLSLGAIVATATNKAKAATSGAGDSEFASAWLDKWTTSGGSFFQDLPSNGGGFITGWPEYRDSPAFRATQARLGQSEYFRALDPTHAHDADLRETLERRTHRWGDAAYHGGMRTMLELLDAVPGGRDAVKAIVRTDKTRGYAQREA